MLFELFRFRVPRVGKFRTSVTTSGWGTPTHRTSGNALSSKNDPIFGVQSDDHRF